ncbi:MAG: hypothetical protein ACREP1_09740, partial [Rhodanobacteraceae bacterium]
MTVDLRLLLEKYGPDFLTAALTQVVGQPAAVVRDNARFKAQVVAAAWSAAPVQIRMLSPEAFHWDEFCFGLRDRVFDTSGGAVALRPNWRAEVAAAIGELAPVHLGDSADLPAAGSEAALLPRAPHGGAAAPLAVGIDLGTTYSVIAYLDSQGRP